MFPPFPGFEDLPIHIEVEWQGRKRPVVARVEQLPTSPPSATLVCSFLDAPDEGEWLLSHSLTNIYTLGNPLNLLQLYTVFSDTSQEYEEHVTLNLRRVEKLQSMIERALPRSGNKLQVVRVVELANLPHPPRIALIGTSKGAWHNDWQPNHTGITSFATTGLDIHAEGTKAQEWLQEQWNDPHSDARFAWEWASWSEEERVARSSGFDGDIREVEQVMRWVFSVFPPVWQNRLYETWELPWRDDVRAQASPYGESDDALLKWESWLCERFFSHWRVDWIEQYLCVREFWEYRSIAEVSLSAPPTMHEQLEARLELRAWLEQNGPEQIDNLLAL